MPLAGYYIWRNLLPKSIDNRVFQRQDVTFSSLTTAYIHIATSIHTLNCCTVECNDRCKDVVYHSKPESCISKLRNVPGIWYTLSCIQVTGGNRGLGYETVRKLCKVFDGVVILTGKISTAC